MANAFAGYAEPASPNRKLASDRRTRGADSVDLQHVIQYDGTAENAAAVDASGQQLVHPGASLLVSGTGAALNDTPIAATDARGYRWVSVQIQGTFSATYVFEISNDNTNWQPYNMGYNTQGQAGPLNSASASGIVFWAPINARYFRVRVSAYTSGTITATAVFSALPSGVPWQSVDTELAAAAALADAAANPSAPSVGALAVAYNGATWDRWRRPNVFKAIATTSVTAGTGITAWTPTSGKKFRLMGWMLSLTVSGQIIFGDNVVGTVIARSPTLAAAGVHNSTDLGNGVLSAAANNVLKIDVTATASVAGVVFGTEE